MGGRVDREPGTFDPDKPIPQRPNDNAPCRRCERGGTLPVTYAHPKTGEPIQAIAFCSCPWGKWKYDCAVCSGMHPQFYDDIKDADVAPKSADQSYRDIVSRANSRYFEMRKAKDLEEKQRSQVAGDTDFEENKLPIPD